MAKEKFQPLTMTQEEWDAIPHVWDGKVIEDDFPEFAELFVENLNENTRDKTAEDQHDDERDKHQT